MRLGMRVEINIMEQKLAQMCEHLVWLINMNSVCLKCGSSLVHLAMTLTVNTIEAGWQVYIYIYMLLFPHIIFSQRSLIPNH